MVFEELPLAFTALLKVLKENTQARKSCTMRSIYKSSLLLCHQQPPVASLAAPPISLCLGATLRQNMARRQTTGRNDQALVFEMRCPCEG